MIRIRIANARTWGFVVENTSIAGPDRFLSLSYGRISWVNETQARRFGTMGTALYLYKRGSVCG